MRPSLAAEKHSAVAASPKLYSESRFIYSIVLLLKFDGSGKENTNNFAKSFVYYYA